MRAEREVAERTRARLAAKVGGVLPNEDAGTAGGEAPWAAPALDDAGWSSIAVPGLWEGQGYDGMDGVAWYRTSFELTEAEAGAGVRLGLGMIDDADVSWVNGHEVGRTNAYNAVRSYAVPASALRAGRNVVAVRVSDTGGGGGVYGDSAALYVDVGGTRRPLAGRWKFRVGMVAAVPTARGNATPTMLYNKMVHPLQRFPIKGVLWYQGESNADRVEDATAYRALFAGMIRDWRRSWGEVPFLWVQLANYMAVDSEPPARSAWATLRESQGAALALPRTGQAVIIDIGETGDIHPRNKQDVGARLALAARRVAYGQPVVASGPTYRAQAVRGGRVVLDFGDVGGGLVAGRPTAGVARAPSSASSAPLRGFAVAGADHRFVWANATTDGRRVTVWSDAVPHPVAVRYAWADNPLDANLYNAEGLPASPFRTDAW